MALLPISVTYADNGTVLKDTMKLPYSSQQIDGADLMKVKDANFVNSLIGRVAVATINPSASGVGGSVRMVLRGYRSILKSNNVLLLWTVYLCHDWSQSNLLIHTPLTGRLVTV
ncbi:hypothetical protein SFC43_21770 [Bacteroides sp. CR5/BHMF/2]|nr:hypothetical protein [Bacteroides sp. CR5/BHMF/2]